MDTGLIARDLDALLARPIVPAFVPAVAALAGLGLLPRPVSADPWQALTGWRAWPGESFTQVLTHRDGDLTVEVKPLSQGRFAVTLRGGTIPLGLLQPPTSTSGAEEVVVTLDGCQERLEVLRLQHGTRIVVTRGGVSEVYDLPQSRDDKGPVQGGNVILSPMPGLVSRLAAKPGQLVRAGEVLIVLEAMKMEHALTSPRDGVVAELLCAEGDQVAHGAQLLVLEPAGE